MKTELYLPSPRRTQSLFAPSFWFALCGGLSMFATANGADLTPDTHFRPPFFARAVQPQRAVLLPDGKYVLFALPDTLTDRPSGAITRFLPDGTLDTSFNFSRIYKSVAAATPAANGKLYVAAARYLYGTKEVEQILRLHADGSLDPNFNPASVGGPDSFQDVRQILVQPDGKVLVAGFFLAFAENPARAGIVRLLTNGTVDGSFAPVTIDAGLVWSAALQPDGKVLIGGTFASVNGVANPGFARFNANGSLDSGFQAAGFFRNATSNPIRGIAIQTDSKIVISGDFRFEPRGTPNRAPLVRLNSDGSLDTTFNSVGTLQSPPTGRDLFLQPDGKIVVAAKNSVYRFEVNGSRDTAFHSPILADSQLDPWLNPAGQLGTPFSVHRFPDGRILVGGQFTDVNPAGAATYAHFGVARLASNGDLDPTLTSSHQTGVETAPSSFARLSDGSTLIAFVDKVDPPIPYNVGRLLSDGSLDPNFTVSSSDANSFLSGGFTATGVEPLLDGNFFVFGRKAGAAGFAYGKVAPSGAHDTAFATEPIQPFQDAIATPDGKVLLSAGTDAQATVYETLTRLQADGHSDAFAIPPSIRDAQVIRGTSDNSIFRVYVGTRVLALQTDGKILFEYLGQDERFHLVRLNADGSIDGGFAATMFTPTDLSVNFPALVDPATNSVFQPPEGVWTASLPLLDANVQPDGRILVAGHFTSYNGSSARGLVRLKPDGTVDNTFNIGNGAQWTQTPETTTSFPGVENIELLPDGKFLITGTFEAFNAITAPGIAMLNANGSVDTSFVAPVQRDKRSRLASDLKRQADGSFLLSGPYKVAGESNGRSLIRLVPAQPGAVNISTRLGVGTGDNVLIEGFIVDGPAGSSKKMLVRAIGPSLTQFGISDALPNPILEIHDASNAIVATNNDWKTTQIGGLITGDQFAEISGSGVAPSNDLESAIIASLEPGSYTAVVRGAGNMAGTGVVDAFDIDAGSSARLANIATRGVVEPGDKLMIAGFIVQNGAVKLGIRAIGPSLLQFGISNALPDTTLQLRDQQGTIVLENDDWQTSQKQELESVGLQPSHDLEAALVTTIQPGLYTAQLRGKGNSSGVGVVQVYFLQ